MVGGVVPHVAITSPVTTLTSHPHHASSTPEQVGVVNGVYREKRGETTPCLDQVALNQKWAAGQRVHLSLPHTTMRLAKTFNLVHSFPWWQRYHAQ